MQVVPLSEIQSKLRPGDIIVFSGSGFLSNGIKLFSHSPLSHVAMVYTDPTKIIESTIEGSLSGPQINDLATRVAGYDANGRVWVLFLSDAERARLDFDKLFSFGCAKIAAKDTYDKAEILQDAVDTLINVPFKENPHEEVCSHFVCELLQAGGHAMGRPCFGMKPQAIAAMSIYSGAVQIKGAALDIPDFNTQ